jgi:methylthioribose-1-phosphate isomerase
VNVQGKPYRTIWPSRDGAAVEIIDQAQLPHAFVVRRLATTAEVAHAISAMLVRGAPLIGAAAGYGVWLAMRADASDGALETACTTLLRTRPTAVNLRWALDLMKAELAPLPPAARERAARAAADRIADEDAAGNKAIGRHGLALIREAADRKRGAGRGAEPVQVLTHCNAGWLATVDWGTALAPVYAAHEAGIPLHVWVDETRPRNQGAALTAWELGQHGVPHTVIVDNAGGHLMQRGRVDLAIVGTDRTTATGDVANKIGTYLKALAAHDSGVPFYVAAPASSIDWSLTDGLAQIPIEERGGDEVATISGLTADGTTATVRLIPAGSGTHNPGFDVTPSRLVTAIITERGIARPAELAALYSDRTGHGTR